MEEAMRLFGIATLGADAYHRLSESRVEQVRANLIKAEFLGSGFPPLDAEQLHSIQAPTLLISGQASPGLFHRLLDRLQELLPDVERIEIPGASYIMHEDNATAKRHVIAECTRSTSYPHRTRHTILYSLHPQAGPCMASPRGARCQPSHPETDPIPRRCPRSRQKTQ